TTDGGATWTPQLSGTTNSIFAVSAVDADTAISVGDATLMRTEDGGASWTAQPTAAYLEAVSFVDRNTGWAVGGSSILHTTDGGATWTLQFSEAFDSLQAVSFVDATTGWAVGRMGTILNTSDGGATWTSTVMGSGPQCHFPSTCYYAYLYGVFRGRQHRLGRRRMAGMRRQLRGHPRLAQSHG